MNLSFKTYFILKSLPKIGNVKALKISKRLNSNIESAGSFLKDYNTIRVDEKGLPELELSDISSAFHSCEKEIEYSQKSNIKLVGYDDDDYPSNYRKIKDPPCILFVKGNISKLNHEKKVAIIGSRDASDYAKEISKKLANHLSKNEIVVVSGLAKGCDEYAHKGSLNGGFTIAILPSGLKNIYPSQNQELASQIVDAGGCLVTEYPSDTVATKYNFVSRNRLQSSLSRAVILVESKINGGSMKTIDFATEQKIKIYCWKHDKNFENPSLNSGNIELEKRPNIEIMKSTDDLVKMINSEFN